jgi:hypothetical protein
MVCSTRRVSRENYSTRIENLSWLQLSFARELGMTPAARMAIHASSTNAALDLAGIASSSDAGDNQGDEGRSLEPTLANEDECIVESAASETTTGK